MLLGRNKRIFRVEVSVLRKKIMKGKKVRNFPAIRNKKRLSRKNMR